MPPAPADDTVTVHLARRRPLRVLPLDLGRGFLIGLAELVPGVSGGTIALITGVYEELLDSVHHVLVAVRCLILAPRERAAAYAELRRADWRLIAPLLVGMAAAVLLVAGLVESFVSGSPELARGLFLGLVLASMAVPVRMLPPGRRPVWIDVAIVLGAAATTFWVVGLASSPAGFDVPLGWVALAAAVAICALVLPGVSGSFFLLVVGLYTATLDAVAGRDLVYLGVFALGAVAGLATFVPVLRRLLETRRRTTLLVMVGLLAGSLRALWPWQSTPEGAVAGEAQGPGDLLAPYAPVLGPVALGLLGAGVVLALVAIEVRGARRLAAALSVEP